MSKLSLLAVVLACTIVQSLAAATVKTVKIPPKKNAPLEWWQETIIYQIYPRSHKDSDGDGVGDLVGIQSSLDYLVDLGVNAVWISPIYKSPMKDFGYDISDFKDIEPVFGNLEQFRTLAAAMREKDIKVIMDFVPNHSSDEHEWFQKSIQREAPYEDYYVWRNASGVDPEGNPIVPNNWVSVFGGSSWTWNENRQQFYLHQFVAGQPDLNFENPKLMEELLDAMKFWLDLGVDGFRVDAVPHMFEDQRFLDEPENPDRDPSTTPAEYSYWSHPYTYNLPQVLDALAEFRKLLDIYTLVDGRQRVMMVEAGVPTLEELFEYYGTAEKPIAHFPFNFELTKISPPLTGTVLQNVLNNWFSKLPEGYTSNWLIGNHDQKRVAKRFGREAIDALNMINLLLPGSTVTYYGEEIGMDDTFLTWEQTVDPAGCQAGPEKYEQYSRDPCRTPMQWNASRNAGFSDGDSTWLPLNPNYETLNVATELDSTESHIKVYKEVSALRKTDAWKYGGLQYAAPNQGQVFGFTRIAEDGTGFLVLVNFGDLLVTVNAGSTFENVPSSAIVTTRNVGFIPTTTVIGSSVTTANIVVGAKSSLIVSF